MSKPSDLRHATALSTLSPQNIEAHQRDMKALELRIAGATFERIALELGYYDRSAARSAILKKLQKTEQPIIEELRELESERLDQLWADLYEKRLSEEGKPNLLIVDRLIRISERRSKLLGLDQPLAVKITPEGFGAAPIEPSNYRAGLAALAPISGDESPEGIENAEPAE